MHSYGKLLLENKAWAAEKISEDPEYFGKIVSFAGANFYGSVAVIVAYPPMRSRGTQPGEIFVHRNVANLVVNTDVNLLAVLDFAVTSFTDKACHCLRSLWVLENKGRSYQNRLPASVEYVVAGILRT